MKKGLTLFVLTVCVLMIVPGMALAGSPWTEETTYGDKVAGKLDFGVRNFLGGWTELITEPKERYDNKGNWLLGIGRGLYNATMFTVGGAAHLVTFPIPMDIPLPENGVQF